MKILHIITTLDMGGAEKQLFTLISEQIAVGDHVTVIYLKGQGELSPFLIEIGAKVEKIPRLSSSIPSAKQKVTRIKPDIIHAHLPQAECLGAIICNRIPLIVSRHNSETFWPKAPKLVSRILSRLIIRRAARVIAISEGVKEYLIKSSEVSKKQSVEVIHYGFNRFKPISVPRRLSKPKHLNFLTISRLHAQKDVRTIILAFSQHIKHYFDSTLTIVGDGKLKNDLLKLAEELGISKKISWFSHSRDVSGFYLNADCFILASRYEGFGLVLLESMQNGLPILASNAFVTSEVLSTHHPGLFPIGDVEQLAGLMEKMTQPVFYNANADFSARRLVLYAPEIMATRVRSIYQSCVLVD